MGGTDEDCPNRIPEDGSVPPFAVRLEECRFHDNAAEGMTHPDYLSLLHKVSQLYADS